MRGAEMKCVQTIVGQKILKYSTKICYRRACLFHPTAHQQKTLLHTENNTYKCQRKSGRNGNLWAVPQSRPSITSLSNAFSLSFYCWPGKMLPGSCLSYSSLVKQLHFILNSIPGDYCCFVPVVVCIFVFGIVGKTMTVSVGERRVQCFGFVFYPQKTLIIFMNVIFGIGLEQFNNCGK